MNKRVVFLILVIAVLLTSLPAVAQAEPLPQHTGPGSRPTPEAVRPAAGWPFGTQGYTCARSRVQACMNSGLSSWSCRIGCWDMSQGIAPTPQPTRDVSNCRWTPSTPWCYGV